MAKAKPSLAAVLSGVTMTPEPAPRTKTPTKTEGEPVKYVAKSREGKSLVGAHLPSEYRRTLKMLSAEMDRPQEVLLRQALDMLFTAQRIELR